MLTLHRLRATALGAFALVGLAALSGCASLQEESQQYINGKVEIKNVLNGAGNLWRIQSTSTSASGTKQADDIFKQAKNFCWRVKNGMLPLRGSAVDPSKDGKTPGYAWLEFRCEEPLSVSTAYKGIHLKLDLGDGDEAAQEAQKAIDRKSGRTDVNTTATPTAAPQTSTPTP